MPNEKFLIVIGGPTAAGKTDLAIHLAKAFGCEIISADSRQFYRETEIGTAKPDTSQLQEVRHHFIGCCSITDPFDIHRFERESLLFLERYHTDHPIAVVVGGSGLYLDALTKGIDELPGRNEGIRLELEEILRKDGLKALQDMLREADPESARSIDIRNPARLIRTLEICKASGMPASSLRNRNAVQRDFKSIYIAVSPDRDTLYRRINLRVEKMMEQGLLDEVRRLLPYKDLQALHTVGYTELFEYLDGRSDLETAIESIKQHTRNYAKRQLTWFRNKGNYEWFRPDEIDKIMGFIKDKTI